MLFKSNTYKFTDKLYRQVWGGPIGLRVTGCAAKIRIARWAKQVLKVCGKNKVIIDLMMSYVDDVRMMMRG